LAWTSLIGSLLLVAAALIAAIVVLAPIRN
jgi:hypothetical protein